MSPLRAKGISETAVKCINNELGIKSKPCLNISTESCHTSAASGGSWLKMYLYIQTDRHGLHLFKLSFSADESNRGWRGEHRLPPPSHMAIVSYKACYTVFMSSPDISQEATDAKLLAKKNPNLQHLVRAVLQFICFVVGFLFPSAFHLSGFYFHSFCSSLLRFVLSCFVFFYHV